MSYNNCICYLLNARDEDVENFNKSISLVRNNLLPNTPADVVVFHESDFTPFFDKIDYCGGLKFVEIEFKTPDYPQEILDSIPELYPHPTHQNGPIAYFHKGFTMGYRHMCRFFAFNVFGLLAKMGYGNYMRLDSDSFILSEVKYNVFEWFIKNELSYSYISQAVQIDNPKVCEGVNEICGKWLEENSIETLTNIVDIPNGMVYYNNFEIANVAEFIGNQKLQEFSQFVDSTGKIYTARWGDHVIRYLQANLFISPEKIKPIHGIKYQHGAIYDT